MVNQIQKETMWTHLEENDEWLYLAPISEYISIQCTKEPMRELHIMGLGILRLNEQYEAFTGNIIIPPSSFAMLKHPHFKQTLEIPISIPPHGNSVSIEKTFLITVCVTSTIMLMLPSGLLIYVLIRIRRLSNRTIFADSPAYIPLDHINETLTDSENPVPEAQNAIQPSTSAYKERIMLSKRNYQNHQYRNPLEL